MLSLLWSINERLSGREGLEIARPDDGWIDDLQWLNERDAEIERARKLAKMQVGAEDDDEGF